MPTISIVIPVYNAQAFIKETLESIIAQTYTDWECILVDDCSTDNSIGIINSIILKEERIKCISLKQNYGSAKIPIKIGVESSTSPWILAMGHDDLLAPDYLYRILEKQRTTLADIVVATVSPFGDKSYKKVLPEVGFDYNQIIDGKDAISLTIPDWDISLLGMLTSRYLYTVLYSSYDYKPYMNSDELDVRILVYFAKKVVFSDAQYNYQVLSSSITRKRSVKLFERLFVDAQLEDFILEKFNKESDLSQKMRKARFDALLFWQQEYWETRKDYKQKDRLEIINIIRKNFNTQDKKKLKKEFNNHSRFWKIAFLSNYLFFYFSSTFGYYYLKMIVSFFRKFTLK